MSELPAHVALTSVLAASVEVGSRPALLAAVAGLPLPRPALDDDLPAGPVLDDGAQPFRG